MNVMKKILVLLLLLAGCSGTKLTFTTPSQPIPLGSTFTIDVSIYNTGLSYLLPDEPWYWVISTENRNYNVNDLYGVAFDLWYDPAIISLQSIDNTQGFLSSAQVTSSFRNSVPGKLVLALSLEGSSPGITGKGNILTLSFLANSPGTTTITIHDVHVYDSSGNKIDASVVINNNGVIMVQ